MGQSKCSNCGNAAGIIKCRDCTNGALLKCHECIVALHRNLPLHRVEVSSHMNPFSHLIRLMVEKSKTWKGNFFEKDSLHNLGYRYQLGHSGARCPCPHPGPKNFIVFTISGPHSLAINYCPLSPWHQLLHEGWFPATLSRPQTVFTFECLKTFHELTLQGKTSLYDYYHILLRRSDNANLSNLIVSF